MRNPVLSTVNGANGEPVAQIVVVESKKELLKFKPNMVEKNAQEKINKTVMKNPVLLIVNGANGTPVALHAVQGIRTGSLSNKPNTVEEIVGEVQSKDAI